MNMVSFGRYLRLLRKKQKLTQQKLAEMINCSLPTISRLEAGKQVISLKLFTSLNEVFEPMGLSYEELGMEDIFDFQGARKELLHAIKKGRVDEIETKMERFKSITEEHKDEPGVDDQQYFLLGHLISTRKRGMSIEQFLDEAEQAFALRRELPEYEDIPNVLLTNIEYQILFSIGEAHMLKGDDETAELIFKGLLKNKLDEISPKYKERYTELSAMLAKIYFRKNEYSTVEECVGYVFNEYIESIDTGPLYKSLILHGEMCSSLGDKKGAKLVNDFLKSNQRLMGHICYRYKIRRYVG